MEKEVIDFKDKKGIIYNSVEKYGDNIAFTIKEKRWCSA